MLIRPTVACRALLRPTFSTFVPASNARGSVNDGLTQILNAQDKVPVPKPLTPANYPKYKTIEAGKVLLPNALTYDAVVIKPRLRSRRAAVAPPPSYTRANDVFHNLSLDPRQFTTNGAILSHYLSEMGKIKSRDQTGLTLKTQRLLGQTIRRAKMMGVIPTLSKSSGL